MTRFVEGNDDTFAMLMFGFFAFMCCLLLIEPMIRQRAYVAEVWSTLTWWKGGVMLAVKQPKRLKMAIDMLVSNMAYTKAFIFPLAKNIIGKWRWAVWITTFFLFSVVAYQKLTFDPYEILGLPPGSDARAIKKAYRQLSMSLHPDVNDTMEAAVRYDRVKKAVKVLSNPDDEREIMSEDGDQRPGVAIPSFLTKPEYALYSMTFLMILLFAAPLYMLFSLKNKQSFNIIPVMIDVAKHAEMAEPFFVLLGQPQNPVRDFEVKEKPALVSFLKKLESAECFDRPEEEIPLASSEIAENFHPEISSCAEVQQLLLDVIEGGRLASASEMKLKNDLNMYIRKDSMSVLRSMVPVPSEDDVKRLEEHKARLSGKVKDDRDYTPVTEEKRAVAMYFLADLLNAILNKMLNLLPPQEGQRKDSVMGLKNIYTTRLATLTTLRKQADEAKDGVISKFYRQEINRAIEQQQSCDKAINEIISEVKIRCKSNQRRWKQEYEQMRKAEKKSKKPKRN
eukprot:TRINITY_DN9844_c1_g2_i1.p1 TRINITY_DN9844_c1_g2~~TRINITY_DN9844_c1_g2_i1.p1  ORF type:complete len:515 (+),score=161.87 TRINITY_DN9844_c1_g2_i1:23-1546(+)